MQILRGMNDILPPEIFLWQEVEQKARSFFGRYGYHEIRTPVLEDMSVFTRTIGETTNIVEKEMYVFQDRGGKWVALRPEGTASVVRAFIEHHLSQEEPVSRFFYTGPMYRYERPQKGGLHQFHQLGAEVFGIENPRIDAEVIHMVEGFFRELGLKNFAIEVNSLGCPLCRPKFIAAFLDFLRKNEAQLCSDCQRRMERNPLRALDCHQETCQRLTDSGPSIQEALCADCEKAFDTVLITLGLLGSQYKVNPKIVRGLDYYIRTTFEVTSSSLGAQNALAGGGRYDGLVKLMGGPHVPGFGFAMGMERLVDVLAQERKAPTETEDPLSQARQGIFLAPLGDASLVEAMKLARQLREKGLTVLMDYDSKSLKSQLRRADKAGVRFVGILGEDELKKGVVTLKDLVTSQQEEVPLSQWINRFS